MSTLCFNKLKSVCKPGLEGSDIIYAKDRIAYSKSIMTI